MARDIKNVTIRVSPDFHKQLRVFLVSQGMTIQDYVKGLIKEDLKKRGVKINVDG